MTENSRPCDWWGSFGSRIFVSMKSSFLANWKGTQDPGSEAIYVIGSVKS